MTVGSYRTRFRSALALPLLLLLALAAAAQTSSPLAGLQPVPRLNARVTDLTGTLTAEQQGALEQKLAAFEAAKGSQIAVLMVPTTHPEEIEQYSIRVVEQWKLGRGVVGGKKVDDGALLLIAKNDHRIRIEVGYGLEGVLTDAMSNRIISETIAPAFRQDNFYEGIDAGVDQMMKLIQGEPLPPPEHSWQGSEHHWGPSILPTLFFAVLIGSVVLRGIFGRTLGSILTGLGAGGLVYIAGYAIGLAAIAALFATLITMLLGLGRAGSGWSSYPRSGGFGGGWGGFGGGGFGGGGGGFGGGGGGFGGGGSSGSW